MWEIKYYKTEVVNLSVIIIRVLFVPYFLHLIWIKSLMGLIKQLKPSHPEMIFLYFVFREGVNTEKVKKIPYSYFWPPPCFVEQIFVSLGPPHQGGEKCGYYHIFPPFLDSNKSVEKCRV